MTTTEEPTNATLDVLDLIDRALAEPEFTAAWKDADDAAVDPEDHPVLEAWKIDGENTATWAAAKLQRAYDRRASAAATAERMRKIADEHLALAIADTDRDVRYFTGKLREYHEAETAGTRRKQTKLPGGTVLKSKVGSVKAVLPEADSDEYAELIAWLEDHTTELPEAVDYHDPTVKVTPMKAAGADGKVDASAPGDYPAVLPETGEVIPHLVYRRGEPTFDVALGDLDPE